MQKEDSVDETHFHNSLQVRSSLLNIVKQLSWRLKTREFDVGCSIMENTKQYISWAVVAAVEHFGSISADLESSLSKSISINPQTNRQIDFLKMRIMECQQQSHQLPLDRFYLTPDFPTHHCRYILPPSSSTDPSRILNVVHREEWRDGSETGDEFETEEPLFVDTHNCKLSLVDNSTTQKEKNNVFMHTMLPVRGDGLSILPKSEQSVFRFKGEKLKRSARNGRDMAWLIRRSKRILA